MPRPASRTLVMITDARCRIPPELQKHFLDWRQSARVRSVALVIGSAPGDLEGVCDEVHRVNAIDPAGDAVGRVLSL